MIALLNFPIAVMLAGFSPSNGVQCAPLDSDAIRSRVLAVQAASRQSAIAESLADLGTVWADTCVSARERASPSVVSNLAALLRIEPRWTVATMLLDVGGNLHYARSAIEQTLRDERASERRRRRHSIGVVMDDPEAIPDSLRCLLAKIRTGREDRRLCRFLLNLREANGFR